jgi:hypothetical protein
MHTAGMPVRIGDYVTHAAALLLGFVLWLIARLAQRAFRNLPPGPKGLPVVGDVLHIADLDWLASPQLRDEFHTPNASRNLPAHVPSR